MEALTILETLTKIRPVVCQRKGTVFDENANKSFSGFLIRSLIIVLGIVAFVAILMPDFLSRESHRHQGKKSQCRANLKNIEGAKSQWALENKKSAGSPVVGHKKKLPILAPIHEFYSGTGEIPEACSGSRS